jgi:RHS repeat-associated protein
MAKYLYDGLHRRVAKILPNDWPNPDDWTRLDYYYNEQWQVLEVRIDEEVTDGNEETTVATDVKYQYVWDIRYIDAPICRDEDKDNDGDCSGTPDGVQGSNNEDERLFYCNDANMNVTALVDEYDGAVLQRYVYDAYGKATTLHGVRDAQGNNTTDWGTPTGTLFANELLYCGYRHDPESALYHVRNRMYHPTLGRWLQRDPEDYLDGMSLYEYVASRPIDALDPSGLWLYIDQSRDVKPDPPREERPRPGAKHKEITAVQQRNWQRLQEYNTLVQTGQYKDEFRNAVLRTLGRICPIMGFWHIDIREDRRFVGHERADRVRGVIMSRWTPREAVVVIPSIANLRGWADRAVFQRAWGASPGASLLWPILTSESHHVLITRATATAKKRVRTKYDPDTTIRVPRCWTVLREQLKPKRRRRIKSSGKRRLWSGSYDPDDAIIYWDPGLRDRTRTPAGALVHELYHALEIISGEYTAIGKKGGAGKGLARRERRMIWRVDPRGEARAEAAYRQWRARTPPRAGSAIRPVPFTDDLWQWIDEFPDMLLR